ncbi:MAG: universal stress protein [Gammaproteobacteria bacterium]|nr:universal stress protein [Gammaproteobacteria bacterium]
MARAKNNILVAVDGSDNALRALKYAVSLLQPDAKLYVLFVHTPLMPSRAISQALIDEHYRREEERALTKARRYLQRAKIDAEIEARIGDPARTIVEHAKKKKCRQIVMGNHGHSAIAGFFLGSVALKVIQLSDIPVTLVK